MILHSTKTTTKKIATLFLQGGDEIIKLGKLKDIFRLEGDYKKQPLGKVVGFGKKINALPIITP